MPKPSQTEASVCYVLLTVSKSRIDKALNRLKHIDKAMNCLILHKIHFIMKILFIRIGSGLVLQLWLLLVFRIRFNVNG